MYFLQGSSNQTHIAMKQLFILLFCFSQFVIIAQDKKLKNANTAFENFAFMDAIDSYEQLIASGLSEVDIYRKLGNANYANANYKEAAHWYQRLEEEYPEALDVDYRYRYAQTLKSIGAYQKSKALMEQLVVEAQNDNRGRIYGLHKDYLTTIKENSGRYEIKNLSINSAASDFAPSFLNESLVFASARDTGLISKNIHNWNNGNFLNLYQYNKEKEQRPKPFSNVLNTRTHESSSCFTKDGNTVYFTRNNAKGGNFKRDGKGISRLKILKAERINGKWQEPFELPFNDDSYSVAHPSLDQENGYLYFASDMPGGFGQSDIYRVKINENGTYGEVQNLGPSINTESRETFPFSIGNRLYFSSDGHPGLGGLDVFATELERDKLQIINLGEPINGTQDDFSFIIGPDSRGYFASNRAEGFGEDDIYALIEKRPLEFYCELELRGVGLDTETLEKIPNVTIVVYQEDKEVFKGQSDIDGALDIPIKSNCDQSELKITTSKDGYTTEEFKYSSNQLNDILQWKLERIQPEIIAGTNLLDYLNLNPIYFDLDKATIRQDATRILLEVNQFLNTNPERNILVQSHTDASAPTYYNNVLAKRRAIATKAWLVNRGIAPDRIRIESYGEAKLVNDCASWKQCNPSQNQLNRRSEIYLDN